MNKNTDTTKPTNENAQQIIEGIEDVELDNVTGGCARCGCGTPAAPNVAAFAAFAATFQRR